MTKTLIILLSTIILSACSLNINVNQDPTPTPVPSNPTVQPTQPGETLTPTETVAPISIEDQLTTFFCNKFNKPASEANLTVSQNTSTHATGGISFQGEIAGAMWLAHNDNGIWIVDYDGNGTIPCQDVEPHNYPLSILTECWDDTTQSVKTL